MTDETASPAALESNRTSIWNAEFTSLFIVNFLMSMGQFMMNALVPKFAYQMGAAAPIVGMVSGIFAVTALAVRPLAGPAIDSFRKDRLLTMSLIFVALAYICYGFAGNVQMLFVGRLLTGLGMGFMGPLVLALASDALPTGKLASGIGIFSLGQAVSTAIGPAAGLRLAGWIGYNNTFFVGAGIMTLVILLTLRLKVPVRHQPGSFRISWDRIIAPEVLTPTIITFFLGGAYSSINSFIIIYGGLCGVEDIALFFMAYAGFVLLSRPLSGRIADRYGADRVLIPGILLFAVSFLMISFARTLPAFLAAGAVSAFGYGICQPMMQSLCMQMVPRERRGVAGNTNYIGMDTAFLIMPTLAGLIAMQVTTQTGSALDGYSFMYRAMLVPMAFALILFLVKRKKLLAGRVM